MSKDKVKTILIVLIVLILCLNVWVYAAYVLSATDVNYTKSNGITVSVKTALDELYTKVPTHEIGDEVTVQGQSFYVLEWDNNCDTVNLIAKYCLNLDGTSQTGSGNPKETNMQFSSNNYWGAGDKTYPLNLNDYIGFTSTDVLGKAKSYGISKGAVSSRLLSYDEAKALINKSSSNSKIKNMLRSGQNFYLGTARNGIDVYYFNTTTMEPQTNVCFANVAGIRPVITIEKSKVTT